MFSVAYRCEWELMNEVKRYNVLLSGKGVTVRVLNRHTATNGAKRALVYVYRKKLLDKILNDVEVYNFLKKYGYNYNCNEKTTEKSIGFLSERFGKSGEFPHEIGIFLGYPLGDVEGFIENGGKSSKCVGCWKVYCDECEALKVFEKYNKCRRVYKKLWNEGRSLLRLTVPA